MSQLRGRTGLAVARLWHNVDLAKEDRTLGRLASSIACTLMGKHKPTHDPSVDIGDYVVVTNCQDLRTTGNKRHDKIYSSHTGKPGVGFKQVTMQRVIEKNGFGEVIRRAVKGMLPRNRLRALRMSRLYVFEDDQHPYKANITKYYTNLGAGTRPIKLTTTTADIPKTPEA